MNFRIISVLAIFGMLSLTSCMQDHPSPSDVQKEIKVSASIEGATIPGVKTRVTEKWDDEDAIGLFMKKSGTSLSTSSLAVNAKYYTNGGGNFSPAPSNEIYFPFNNDIVDFIAYYPYKDDLEGLNYPVDVSNQSNLSDIEFLYSDDMKEKSASDENVDLTFKHQLSTVILDISMVDGFQKDLIGLTVDITNVNTKASFSLVDGKFKDESDPKSVSFNMSSDGSKAKALLLPTASLDNKSLVFSLDDVIYTCDLSTAEEIDSFNKSTIQILNIALKPGENPKIVNVKVNIEDWIDGKTEDLIAEENSTYTPPGKPAEGDEDDEEDLNEEDDQYMGDGSYGRPFTVEQVQIINPAKDKWVKGYIVGYYALSSKSSLNKNPVNQNNVAIADSPMETNPEQTFKINFDSNVYVGDPINLKNNPENKSKMAYFRGDIAQSNNISLLKNVTEAFIVNTTPEE